MSNKINLFLLIYWGFVGGLLLLLLLVCVCVFVVCCFGFFLIWVFWRCRTKCQYQISFIPGSSVCLASRAWFQEGKTESLVTPEKLISRSSILKVLYSFTVMMLIVKVFTLFSVFKKKIKKNLKMSADFITYNFVF